MSKTPVPKQQKGDSSYFTYFNKSVGEISDSKWRDLIEQQDYDTMILDIREDLIAQVTDECYKKYLKREVYKFLVECAHKAFQQIITLHFYIYDDSHKYCPNKESWMPDEEPLVCKPDSWAKGNIPYNVDDIPKSRAQQTDPVYSDYNLVKCDEYPSTHVFDATSAQIEPDLNEEEQSPFVCEMAPSEPAIASQASVQFNDTYNYTGNTIIANDPIDNYDFMRLSTEIIPDVQDLQPNRLASENMFYRIMKVGMASNLSLQTTKRVKQTNPPNWTSVDEVRDESNRALAANRYLQMRRECVATVDRKPLSKK